MNQISGAGEKNPVSVRVDETLHKKKRSLLKTLTGKGVGNPESLGGRGIEKSNEPTG